MAPTLADEPVVPLQTDVTASPGRVSGAWYGLAGGIVLVAAAMIIPPATGWDVWATFPPILAVWLPRLRVVSAVAGLVALAGVWRAEAVARRARWSHLLLSTWVATATWSFSLALVDGRTGLGPRYDTSDFIHVANHTRNVSDLLQTFVSHINGPHPWPTHVAGHPPGALLFFVGLERLGVGAGIGPGIVLTLLAASTPVAVLVALRALGLESGARLAAPFLVFCPVVIWETVSADALYGCLAAWCLAFAATAARRRSWAWALGGGVLFGGCLFVSYGLVLWAVPVVAVLWIGDRLRLLPWVVIGAGVVVVAFWAVGFDLWSAYPAIHQRYWDGIASARPTAYWIWADLAALCISAGPAMAIAVGNGVERWHLLHWRGWRTSGDEGRLLALGAAMVLTVVLADVSLMSKAEVERIWIPFVPWLLVLAGLLPTRWRRIGLVLQVATALAVQHLLFTVW